VTGITGAFLFFYTIIGLGVPQSVRADVIIPAPTISAQQTNDNISPPEITLNYGGSTDANQYAIYRTTGGTPSFPTGTSPYILVSSTITTYRDSAVTMGQTYNYWATGRLATVDGFGFPTYIESSPSEVASVTVQGPVTTPHVFAELGNPATTTAHIWWEPATSSIGDPLLAYKLTRSTDGVHFSLLATLGPTTTEYYDSPLSPGTRYYYTVTPFYDGDGSDYDGATYTPPASVFPPLPDGGTTPPPPGGGGGGGPFLALYINATPVSSSEIDVTWPFVSGALYYYVYSGTNAGTLIKVGDGAKGVTNVHFEHVNLTPATKYYYKVEAYDGSGLLVTSNIVNATTFSTNSTSSPSSTPPVVVNSSVDECGSQDWMSPVKITDPNSGVKFTKLPDRAIFRPTETPAFNYCFRNPTNSSLKIQVRRSFFNTLTLKDYNITLASSVLSPAGDPARGDRFSLARSQYLDRTLPLGEYRVRVQVISEQGTSVGDEVLAAAPNQVDENSFIFLVDDTKNPSLNNPPTDNPPPPLLKPTDPSSDLKFINLPKQAIYWAGQGLRVGVTYRNNSGEDQLMTLQCDLLDQDGNLIDRQEAKLPLLHAKQMFKFTTGKGCMLPGSQPLSLLLPTAYYTFRVQLLDRDSGTLVDTNSFNFKVVKKR
jgi:hypothetical protein